MQEIKNVLYEIEARCVDPLMRLSRWQMKCTQELLREHWNSALLFDHYHDDETPPGFQNANSERIVQFQ
jgi:hypothetical protein